jgi:enoyl-CoA hydratase/carnithine racemase
MRMMARCELIDAPQALAWGLADAVIADGPGGEDVARFVEPLNQCPPQVLRGIKAQAIAARRGADWAAHRKIEQRHLVETWLHQDHWSAAEKLLSKS